MSTSLGYSEFETTDLMNNLKKKNVKPNSEKNEMLFLNNDNDSDNVFLADFKPPPKPMSVAKKTDNKIQEQHSKINPVKPLESTNTYYNKYIPSSSSKSNMPLNNDELSKKINYMIHLLEEQQEVKQGCMTEELVLYCFLGVFIIFLVDSFTKVGKYVR